MPKNIVFPTRKESAFGWCYLLFCQFFLVYVINFICTGMGLTLSNGQLNLAYFGVNFLVVTAVFHRFLLRTGKDILEKTLRILVTAGALFVLYLLVSQLLGRLILWLKPDFANANDQTVAAVAESYYLPTLICTVFLVPVTEECLHRGAVFGGLFKVSPVAAYAVSTIVFALVHINWYAMGDPVFLALNILQYIPAGLCLAAAYHISGSITAPILIHMAVNAIGILALR